MDVQGFRMADGDRTNERPAHSVVCAPGEGQVISFGDAGAVTLKVVGRDSAGTMSAYEFVVPPATAGPPLHLHQSWDEAFYVLEGVMTFLIDGRTSSAPAGSFVFIPRGIPHTFWNESAATAKQLTVFHPAGIEAYFEEVTRVIAAGGDDTLAAATALMEKHDMIVPPGTREAYGALTRLDESEE
jgi:quercetin dioxygenase-like cupin family protein